MVAPKSVRHASSRTHIKQALTVWIVTAIFVHFAYMTLTAAIRCAPPVAVNSRELLWQRELSGKVS